MFWNIDRIEEQTAVLISEEGQMEKLPLASLPAGVREGDWGQLVGGVFMPDPIETEKRRRRIRALLEDLIGE